MKVLTLTILFVLLFVVPVSAQEVDPEEVCIESGDYWSDDLSTCFLVEAFDEDELLLHKQINAWLAEKDYLNHEDKEYSVPNKNAAVASFDARITSLTSKRDGTDDDEVKAVYQAEIDSLTEQRDAYDATVVNHGTLISDLSRKIGKTKEELDKLLTQ